jgi:hypothetical protein
MSGNCATGATASTNYAFNDASHSFTISKAELAITWAAANGTGATSILSTNNQSIVYDSISHGWIATVTGLSSKDTSTLSRTFTGGTAPALDDSGPYTYTFNAVNVRIVTGSVTAYSVSVIFSDNGNYTLASGTTATSTRGWRITQAPITPSWSAYNASGSAFSLAGSGTDDGSITYDGINHGYSITYSGLKGSDTVTFTRSMTGAP